jgi:cell division septation protein DedD
MSDLGAVRNLEQIQESDAEPRVGKGVTIALVSLGGACVLFAGLAFGGKRAAEPAPKADPLGELVREHTKAQGGALHKATDLGAHDVTFPAILSDDKSPTTALAAVKGANAAAPPAPAAPPAATERLPVVPLPAQNVLEATPVVTRPRDALTKAASDGAQIAAAPENDKPEAKAPDVKLAPSGREGGYQLQVSSFRTQAEASQFATQLRARNHKAYVLEAHVPGRGTWYRVRIGPFTTQHAAAQYRAGFEGREHVVPFIVPPGQK